MEQNPSAKSRSKLALGATIVLAAAPVSVYAQVAPDAAISPATTAAPSPSAPVIVIPNVTAAPDTAPAPIAVDPVTIPQTGPIAPAASTRATRAAAPTRAVSEPIAARPAPGPTVSPVNAAPVSSGPTDSSVNSIDQVDGAPPVADQSAAPPPTSDGGVPVGLLAALGIVGVAGAGFLASRRRRTGVEEADGVYVTPTEPVALTPEPVTPADAYPREIPAPAVVSIPVAAPTRASVASSGPSLVEGQPAPTGEARQDMLDRMVAAEPDEANPFRTAQRRRKRARLILQAHDARVAEQAAIAGEAHDPAFDWRNWKGSGSNSATPSVSEAQLPEPVA